MKAYFTRTCVITIIAIIFLTGAMNCNGQIISYTNATSGALNTITANVTATPLTQVNGAAASSIPCGTGFSSSHFTGTGTYSTSLPAVEVSVSPNAGYNLNLTGFSANLRRSGTGPASVRFAYSTNGGSTWTSQSTNQNNPDVSCGDGTTFTWTTTASVSSPNVLKFRIYGFSASGTSGNEQILNLVINGTVVSTCTPPVLSTTATNVKCNGGNTGAVALTVTGTAPFVYHWSNGAATQNISNLNANTYSVTVTSGNSCSATAGATVSQPAVLSTSVSAQTNTTCNGNTGSATVNASGGTSPYTYLWSTNPAQSGSAATALAIGSYMVTITDAQSCISSASASIGVLSPASLSANSITSSAALLTWAAISGASSYNIQYRVTGATSWINAASNTNSLSLSGLNNSTSYQWQVQAVCSGLSSTFSSSSTFTTLATVCTPPALSTNITNVKCNGGNTGLIVLSTTGGSSPFTFHWNNGATTQNDSNLIAGTYNITVSASGGCSVTASATISQPAALSASVSASTNTSCNGNTGSATVIAAGGTSPYTYLWNTNPAQNSSTANSLAIGTYAATVTDADRCIASATATIGLLSPGTLAAKDIAPSSVVLSWSAISGASSYNIQYRVNGTNAWTTTSSNSDSLSISGLNSATTYQWQVQAVCSGVTSVFSNIATFTTASAIPVSSHIKVYFNRPVNTSLATNQPAVFVNQTLADTLITYINRAKYTIDIAQYDYIQTSKFSNIATAINNAYTRGIKVRWIYNGSSSNSGLSQLNAAIPTLVSPTTSAYGIMHNKFMIVDAHSSNSSDPVVWTGSMVWEQEQIDSDFNNIIIVQDQNLANTYTVEFNQMWGDTGMTPNSATSKFGPYKSNITQHTFTIDSSLVECYFSPSDGTNSHIIDAIGSANSQLFFGVYTFTDVPDADSIISRKNAGVYTAGIIDQYSNSYSAYPLLQNSLGNMFEDYARSTSIYHNKYLIVDPCNLSSDPLVETGSHNWTVSADTKNDENILIVHNATIANIYYQAFDEDFTSMGGALNNCIANQTKELEMTTATQESSANNISFKVFPNPSSTQISVQLEDLGKGTMLRLINTLGQTALLQNASGTDTQIDISHLSPGIYFLEVNQDGKAAVKKILITR